MPERLLKGRGKERNESGSGREEGTEIGAEQWEVREEWGSGRLERSGGVVG